MSTESVPSALAKQLAASKDFFERSTRVLDEADSGFRPQPGMMTVAQQVAHTAQTLDWFIEGACRPEGFDLDFEKHAKETEKVTSLAAARWVVAAGGGPENAGGLGHRHGRRLGLRLVPARPARAAIASLAVATIVAGGAGAAGAQLLGAILPSGAVLGTASSADPGFVTIGEAPAGWHTSGD